jgi:mannose-1-phosphate guanylyltransferase
MMEGLSACGWTNRLIPHSKEALPHRFSFSNDHNISLKKTLATCESDIYEHFYYTLSIITSEQCDKPYNEQQNMNANEKTNVHLVIPLED